MIRPAYNRVMDRRKKPKPTEKAAAKAAPELARVLKRPVSPRAAALVAENDSAAAAEANGDHAPPAKPNAAPKSDSPRAVTTRPAKPNAPSADLDPLLKASDRLRDRQHLLLEAAKSQVTNLTTLAEDQKGQRKALERLLTEQERQRKAVKDSYEERDAARAEVKSLQGTLERVMADLEQLQRAKNELAAQLEASARSEPVLQPSMRSLGSPELQLEARAVAGAGEPAAPAVKGGGEEEAEDDPAGTKPQYFTRFQLSQPLEDVAERYRAWILGVHPYTRIRRNRLNTGVLEEWTTDTLRDYQLDLEGEKGLKISVRTSEDEILLRLAHPDQKRGDELVWVNLARLRPCEGGTEVEHAILRASENPLTWEKPGIPGPVQDLLKEALVTSPWDDFRNDARLFHKGTVKDLVALLVNPARDLPIVVVSRDREQDVPLIDPDGLAKDMHGVAVVYSPAGGEAPFLLTDALAQAGLDRQFSVFGGAIRVYMPGLSVASGPYRHPLFLGQFIQKRGAAFVRKLVVRCVMDRAVASRARPGFMQAIGAWDLAAAKANYEALRLSGSDAERLVAAEQRIRALEAAHESARQEAEYIPLLQVEISELRQELQVAHGLLEISENETKEARQDNFRLKSRFEALEAATPKTDASNGLPTEFLDGLISDSWSAVGRLLRMLQIRFQDRLLVLPSALHSADASEYEYLNELKELLLLFCTDYWDVLRTAGDAQAAKLLGDRYASHESSTLSAEGRRQRTFEYKGSQVLMERHLKRTHGHERNSSNRVIRVHFYWDSEDRKLVIGWCGRHLPL